MKKLFLISIISTVIITNSTKGQTINPDIFLNIVQPYYTSIPSSEFGDATFGPEVVQPIYGELAYALDGIDTFACNPVNDLSAKIALVDRGECNFVDKVLNSEIAGAVAVIICNNTDEVVNMGNTGNNIIVNIPSIHLKASHCETLKIALDSGETVFLGLSLEASPVSIIQGMIAHDENLNCAVDPDENSLGGFQITATKNNYTVTSYSNPDGHYNLFVDTGSYEVQLVPPSQVWANCDDPINVVLQDYDDNAEVDFPAVAIQDCALMTVNLASPLLRRCFENGYQINYCNLGSITAEDAYVTIALDPFFTLISSTAPYTEDNNVLTFELGDIVAGECGQIQYVAELSCDAQLGMTVCTQANIFPNDRSCLPLPLNWDGVDIYVDGHCNSDQIQFSIENKGENNMLNAMNYKLIRNAELMETGSYLLEAGASKQIDIPADGATYRIEAEQSGDHPWENFPSATVEACSNNGEFELGFFSQFPVADYGDNYDELCQEVIGSYDPNDKQGFPLGYGEKNYIEKNVDLRYLIRFQNTGTDTAFKVVVTDEISEHLDMRTFKAGASSHNYTININDNFVQWTFDNIMLPDSFVNEPASNGWFEFEIAQNLDIPLETKVENTAAIYFDFNEPVITNTTLHTVGEDFLPTGTHETSISNKNLHIRPNPAKTGSLVSLASLEHKSYKFSILNIQGQVVQTGQTNNGNIQLMENLDTGIYIVKIILENGKSETGRVFIE